MKPKYLFQILVLLAILFSALGTGQQAQAQTAAVQIVMRDLTYWDSIYTGYVDATRYEKWPLNFAQFHEFTVTATPTSSGGLSPLILLLDSNGNEIAQGIGVLTSKQPMGSYYIQIQPKASVENTYVGGTYSLTIREVKPPEFASVSIVFDPSSIGVGETSTAIVSLKDVPTEGYTSVEFTCFYDPAMVEVSNIFAGTDLFGADAAVAINGPLNGSFIIAIAGSKGNKVVADGAAFTFSLKGLQVGQTPVECRGRVSRGDSTLTDIAYDGGTLKIGEGVLTGQVIAGKPVTVLLRNADGSVTRSVIADADGKFTLSAPVGEYTAAASADGFLDAMTTNPAPTTVTLTSAAPVEMETISLLAGDIDNNDVVDNWDAMTIGAHYNTAEPAAADLNNDGTINVLDLELVARNYRAVGPIDWKNK